MPSTKPCLCQPGCLQVVLEGQRVLPRRAQEAGFRFQFTNVADALRSVLR